MSNFAMTAASEGGGRELGPPRTASDRKAQGARGREDGCRSWSLMPPQKGKASPKPRLNLLFTMFPVLLYCQCSGKTGVKMDASFGSKDNLLSFAQSSPTDHGRTVLNLVFQAAEVFSGMEEQVRETEARAQAN
jgi:hypothetical protein